MNKFFTFKKKKYKHIDFISSLSEYIPKIKNPSYVCKHGFYPFIGNEIIFKKYCKQIDGNTLKHYSKKCRPIKYASHIDSLIYQWYSYKLNEKYNVYAVENGFNGCSVAYRTCFHGKCSINFAKSAIDFIKTCGDCYILVSDFSNFFDKIDHKILKENLKRVLGVSKLSEDWFKVYKSMTRYCYINKCDIEKYLVDKKIETEKTIRVNKCLFENILWNEAKKDLKEYINDGVNKNNYGIPQGASLSGIFANVFMIDFDYKMSLFVKNNDGFYMRYSDDIIVVVPCNKILSIQELWNQVCFCKDELSNLEINKSKTCCYRFVNNSINSLHEYMDGFKKSPNFISFLGFSFDGSFVKFRDKTIIKFYYKIYRKIDSMVKRERIRLLKGKKRKSKIDKHYVLKKLKKSKENIRFANYLFRTKKVFVGEKFIQKFDKNIKNKVFNRFNKQMHKFNIK